MTKRKVNKDRVAFEMAMAELKISERIRNENYEAHIKEWDRGGITINKTMADYNEGMRDGLIEAMRVLNSYFNKV